MYVRPRMHSSRRK
ncbi:hypothetical protein CFP56_034498 [Quercus suber]|uniref:Uncharacterized protein n=1 Tax=Quercus suber TaxID=58331 RepID=A0AAW0LTN5_QUESU